MTTTYTAPTSLSGTVSGMDGSLSWGPSYLDGSAPVLLLHFDDGNGSNAFTDSSPSALNFLPAHSATESTANSKFGIGSFVATGGLEGPVPYRILASSGDPIDLHATPAWTIEGWVYFTVNVTQDIFTIGNDISANYPQGVQIITNGGSQLELQVSGATASPFGVPAAGVPSLSAWHHWAAVKMPDPLNAGYDIYQIFLDGVGGGWSNQSPGSGYIGPYTSWGGQHTVVAGYYDQVLGDFSATSDIAVDEIRISAFAVYTANFTPPTSAFSASGTPAPGYDVWRDGVSVATYLGTPGYVDTVPTPGSYTYEVFGWDGTSDVSPGSNIITLDFASSTTKDVYGKFAPAGSYAPTLLIDAKGIKPRIYMPKENVTVNT